MSNEATSAESICPHGDFMPCRECVSELESKLREAEQQRDRYREIGKQLLSELGECEQDNGGRPYCLRHHHSWPCEAAVLRDKYDVLEEPSP